MTCFHAYPLYRIGTNLFLLWSVLVGVLVKSPECFLWFGKESIGVGLGINARNGHDFETEDFVRVWKEPKVIGLGVCPVPHHARLGCPDRLLDGFASEMAVGLILVASCPGGTASNVVVFWLGKGRASVSMTLASTLALWMTPPDELVRGYYLPVDPWALFKGIIMVVLLPLTVGVGWNRFSQISRKASAYSPLVSVLLILLIVGFVQAAKRTLILENWVTFPLRPLLYAGLFSAL